MPDIFTCPFIVNSGNWIDGTSLSETGLDTFQTSQEGNMVTVVHTSSGDGWDFDLRFKCCNHDFVGSVARTCDQDQEYCDDASDPDLMGLLRKRCPVTCNTCPPRSAMELRCDAMRAAAQSQKVLTCEDEDIDTNNAMREFFRDPARADDNNNCVDACYNDKPVGGGAGGCGSVCCLAGAQLL